MITNWFWHQCYAVNTTASVKEAVYYPNSLHFRRSIQAHSCFLTERLWIVKYTLTNIISHFSWVTRIVYPDTNQLTHHQGRGSCQQHMYHKASALCSVRCGKTIRHRVLHCFLRVGGSEILPVITFTVHTQLQQRVLNQTKSLEGKHIGRQIYLFPLLPGKPC